MKLRSSASIRSAGPSLSCCPLAPVNRTLGGRFMRIVGLDIHRVSAEAVMIGGSSSKALLALWLTHIPTEAADSVSFRAHEGDTGRRHAKGQASRQARSRERSASRA